MTYRRIFSPTVTKIRPNMTLGVSLFTSKKCLPSVSLFLPKFSLQISPNSIHYFHSQWLMKLRHMFNYGNWEHYNIIPKCCSTQLLASLMFLRTFNAVCFVTFKCNNLRVSGIVLLLTKELFTWKVWVVSMRQLGIEIA